MPNKLSWMNENCRKNTELFQFPFSILISAYGIWCVIIGNNYCAHKHKTTNKNTTHNQCVDSLVCDDNVINSVGCLNVFGFIVTAVFCCYYCASTAYLRLWISTHSFSIIIYTEQILGKKRDYFIVWMSFSFSVSFSVDIIPTVTTINSFFSDSIKIDLSRINLSRCLRNANWKIGHEMRFRFCWKEAADLKT